MSMRYILINRYNRLHLGHSANYGNVVWAPAFNHASCAIQERLCCMGLGPMW
jgi:hypothetical protein